MMLLLYIVLTLYAAMILSFAYGFTRLEVFKETRLGPKTRFTVVVPFRNEANNLPQLLESFSKLSYPKDFFEVIFVDDASEDIYSVISDLVSVRVVANIRVSGSPKKDAILTAIKIANYEWVITTDADCIVKPNWLLMYDNLILNQPKLEMIAGAVIYDKADSFLHQFQQMDLASLQGATIGSFGFGKAFMCNGANFAYTKSFFESVNGFYGNTTFAGGDDVFLLQKAVAQYPDKVGYLKSVDAAVVTKPLDSWKALFFQRVRWAAKTSGYQSRFGKFVAVVVFLGNVSWVLGFGCWFLGTGYGDDFGILSVMKFTADYLLISQTSRFLGDKVSCFFRGSLIYPFFSTFVALHAMIGKYEWKGRTFKK